MEIDLSCVRIGFQDAIELLELWFIDRFVCVGAD